VAENEGIKERAVSIRPELQELKDLYDLMVREGLDAVELEKGDSHIKLSRAALASALELPVKTIHRGVHERSESYAAAGPSAVPGSKAVVSPLAGVFYRASSPSAAPFVKEGDVVEPGQTLCIVEAMKVMNEIKSEQRCRVVRIAAENSRPVFAGQELFFMEPAG
jgi:acetyl-CoA carboxylase biotin carboxyl carrier protein